MWWRVASYGSFRFTRRGFETASLKTCKMMVIRTDLVKRKGGSRVNRRRSSRFLVWDALLTQSGKEVEYDEDRDGKEVG